MSTKIRTKKITEFLDTDYREYSMSVIEDRAIPSVIDGFKPVQRKIASMADEIWKTGKEKGMKIFQLGGLASSKKNYLHGDSSMNDAITSMCQKFKNNIPLLTAEGQVGSLRSTHASSPRYVGCHLSENFRLVYKDFELLKGKEEEGMIIEPHFFLPILPAILLNGTSGISIGFSSKILNRNPKEVTQACIDYLNGKKIKELKPYQPEFTGTWKRDKDNKNKWWISGKYEIVNTTTVHVSDLPPDITFEKYETYLDSLVDKKIIKDYDNNASVSIDYTLKFKREDLQKLIDEDRLESVLKIHDSETENLTTIDENGKLKIFDCAEDILRYFVDFRLTWYQKRKDYLINKYIDEYKILSNKAKFIKHIIQKKLNVNNKPKIEIVKYLEINKFDKINGSFDYLIGMPIYSLTKERYAELLKQCAERKQLIDDTKKKDVKDMYIDDLDELKKKLK